MNVAVAALFGWIGSKRKIGGAWGFLLALFLGFIGWIIVLCSKKVGPEFQETGKGGEQ